MSNEDELLRIERLREDLPRRGRAGRRRLRPAPRRGARAARRERRGQEHADEDPRPAPTSPTRARILLDGEEVRDPQRRRTRERLGIATIYQELNLVPDLTVAENIFLGREPRRVRAGRPARRCEARGRASCWSASASTSRPRARVRDLGIAQQQMVEIAKALSLDAARADHGRADRRAHRRARSTALRASSAAARATASAIVYITHHLEEIVRDRRPGHGAPRRQVGRPGCRRADTERRARPADGRAVDRAAVPEASARAGGRVLLAVARPHPRRRLPRHRLRGARRRGRRRSPGWSAPAGPRWRGRSSARTRSTPGDVRSTASRCRRGTPSRRDPRRHRPGPRGPQGPGPGARPVGRGEPRRS